jgi:RNA polymerase sigma-70 factor, ECF subfamily
LAGTTGLEPATSDVTGRRSNQLNYVPAIVPPQVCGVRQVGDFQHNTGSLVRSELRTSLKNAKFEGIPMPGDPLSPNALPAFAAAGDLADQRSRLGSRLEEEVVALFDQFRNPLLRYLLSFGLTIQDGEEVVQEVFLALFQHLQRGKSRANLRGWVFRVAHNLALKRRYQTRRSLEVGNEGGAEELVIDPAPDPEAQLAISQYQQRLLAVLHALPEQSRMCLSLRAEGLRYREIAQVLGMSLGAVSLSLARSLARFARASER